MDEDDAPLDEHVASASGPEWKVGRAIPGLASMTWDHLVGGAEPNEGDSDDNA
jgi:hypothetical protein